MKAWNWKKILLGIGVVLIMLLVYSAMCSTAIASEKVTYTVKQGDTLGELMYAWRVQGVEIEKLYTWNPELGTQIKVGQEIIYNLPLRPDQKKLSDQEVKKIVFETMSQMEASQLASKVEMTKKEHSMYLLSLSLGIAVVATLFFALTLAFLKTRSKAKIKASSVIKQPDQERFPETNIAKEPIVITIKGHEYEFYPEITEDGRFKTLYEIEKGRFMFVSDQGKLRNSLRTSFSKNQASVQDLLKQGRLRLQIH